MSTSSVSRPRPIDSVRDALVAERSRGSFGLVPFITAGYPRRDGFVGLLDQVSGVGSVVEVGVPFSAPMADGLTIQHSSTKALEQGVHLEWIIEQIGQRQSATPVLLMSYLNPILAFGFESFAQRAAQARIAGLIVPDLPFEESATLREALELHGLGQIQLVSPVSSQQRVRTLCDASRGFVYAVARTGPTGTAARRNDFDPVPYLERVKSASTLPVCAGFGVRNASQARALAEHVDGVIVGSALIDCIDRGDDPAAFLEDLKRTS